MQLQSPIWQIAIFGLQATFCFWLLWVGIEYSRPNLRVADVAGYSVPLIYTFMTSGLSWWIWASGQQPLSLTVAIGSFVLLIVFMVVVLSVGI